MANKSKQNNNTKQEKPSDEYVVKNQYGTHTTTKKPGKPTKKQQKAKKISQTIKEKHTIPEEKYESLRKSFLKGLGIRQACLKASIHPQTYYNRKEKYPETFDYLELLKENPYMQSIENIADGIEEGDIELSKYWLSNAKNSDFNNKQVNQNNYIQQNNYYNELSEDELENKLEDLQKKLGVIDNQ